MSQATGNSLFQKLGGEPAMRAVVEVFYEKVLADPLLQGFFTGTDMARQKRHQVAFVGMALGGPQRYQGRPMAAAHTGLGIADRHFDAIAGHLQAALQQTGVGDQDITTILTTIESLRPTIVRP